LVGEFLLRESPRLAQPLQVAREQLSDFHSS
jgi:hypothetical protein